MSDNELNLIDKVGIVSEQLEDYTYLMQEIKEDYFDKYNGDNEDDKKYIVWEHKKYGSLFRILEERIYSISKLLKS